MAQAVDLNAPMVFFDLDGVLADFDRHGKEHGKFRADGSVNWDALDYEWWKTMPACEGAREFYDETQAKVATRFLTAPPLSEEALSGKAHWIGEFTGKGKFAIKELITCQGGDKQFFAAPNRILVDDRIKNIEQWEAAGGVGIHHTGDFAETGRKLDEALARINGKDNAGSFTARVTAKAEQTPGAAVRRA